MPRPPDPFARFDRSRSVTRLAAALLILSFPALLAATCRKKPPTDSDDGVVIVDVPDVAVQLQVVSVSPPSVPPATPTPVRVYGAGFETGATVSIGAFGVAGVVVADPNTLELTAPGLPEGAHDVKVTNPNGASATLRQGIRAARASDDTCSRMAMYFELDSASLSTPAQGALNAALPCLRTKAQTRLEGHADERGTTDYNVALGQRRAETVQRFLVSQGIPDANLPLVSYGEERPQDPGHSEAAWAKNRRVDLVSR